MTTTPQDKNQASASNLSYLDRLKNTSPATVAAPPTLVQRFQAPTAPASQDQAHVKPETNHDVLDVMAARDNPGTRKAQSHASTARLASPTTKEQSLARAAALDKLMTGTRHGAKIVLWRDFLNSHQAVWGNIKKGASTFSNELAQRIEEALELEQGWLDAPVFPPKHVAPWLHDASVPLPKVKASESKVAKQAPKAISQEARTSTQQTQEQQTPSMESYFRLDADEGLLEVEDGQADDQAQESQELELTLISQELAQGLDDQLQAEQEHREDVSNKKEAGAFVRPSTNEGQRQKVAQSSADGEVGVVAAAVAKLIRRQSKEGRFSERDALELLNHLMNN